jgi:uncharacterized protein YjiK
MPIIELLISDELDKALSAVSGNKKDFIIKAVKEKLQETKLNQLKDKLVEGYSKSHDENLSLVKEFDPSDIANWDDY